MRLLRVFFLMWILIMGLNAGKVKWGADGKPKIEAPKKPVKGCNKADLNSLLKDNNSSKCK